MDGWLHRDMNFPQRLSSCVELIIPVTFPYGVGSVHCGIEAVCMESHEVSLGNALLSYRGWGTGRAASRKVSIRRQYISVTCLGESRRHSQPLSRRNNLARQSPARASYIFHEITMYIYFYHRQNRSRHNVFISCPKKIKRD